MMWCFIFLIVGIIAGVLFGMTIGADWLDRPVPRKPARIPLASVLQRAEWRRLDVPAMRRRQRVPVIDVEVQ